MDAEEFRRYGRELIDWIADYLTQARERPVNPGTAPGSVRRALPDRAPEKPEPFDDVLDDFRRIVVPNLVHWNHPSFFAYFPANNSFPSILGELLSAGLGVNGMNWATSPAVTELEETVMEWMRDACGLPEHFRGCIQDTASTATLTALLCAREKTTGRRANREGLAEAGETMTVYASREAHSSVEKAAKIAGFGREYFRPVDVDDALALDPSALQRAVETDLAAGRRPCAVAATVGATSSTAVDPVRAIGKICRRYGLWLHVDGALAGSAALLPEKRGLIDGLELADSYVFNAHKWLFTNFDCSLYYVADVEALTSTFEILPEYLKSARDDEVTNFRDWGIPLGRRFRALKLWFVLRTFGLEGLRDKLRRHLAFAQKLAEWIEGAEGFEVMAPVPLQTVCFRHRPEGMEDGPELNQLNDRLIDAVNSDGRILLTRTMLGERTVLRFSIGQTETRLEDVRRGWEIVLEKAAGLSAA